MSPKKLEVSLRKTAKQRGYGPKRTRAYVFGALRRTGWKPKRR